MKRIILGLIGVYMACIAFGQEHHFFTIGPDWIDTAMWKSINKDGKTVVQLAPGDILRVNLFIARKPNQVAGVAEFSPISIVYTIPFRMVPNSGHLTDDERAFAIAVLATNSNQLCFGIADADREKALIDFWNYLMLHTSIILNPSYSNTNKPKLLIIEDYSSYNKAFVNCLKNHDSSDELLYNSAISADIFDYLNQNWGLKTNDRYYLAPDVGNYFSYYTFSVDKNAVAFGNDNSIKQSIPWSLYNWINSGINRVDLSKYNVFVKLKTHPCIHRLKVDLNSSDNTLHVHFYTYHVVRHKTTLNIIDLRLISQRVVKKIIFVPINPDSSNLQKLKYKY